MSIGVIVIGIGSSGSACTNTQIAALQSCNLRKHSRALHVAVGEHTTRFAIRGGKQSRCRVWLCGAMHCAIARRPSNDVFALMFSKGKCTWHDSLSNYMASSRAAARSQSREVHKVPLAIDVTEAEGSRPNVAHKKCAAFLHLPNLPTPIPPFNCLLLQ